MSISSRTYDNERKRRKPFFALSRGVGAFAIAITLLAAGGGFALISPTPMTAALAQEENNTTASATISNTTTTTSAASSSSSGIELSPELVYQEQEKLVSQIPINQTHFEVIVSGNGTLSLPNSTETIMTTNTKRGIVSMMDGTFAGKEILTTEDGSENATATVYEIVRFNVQDGTGRGIAIAVFHTNSTGKLAPLDGMILTGQDELYPDGTGLLTLWEWQSGIP
jgi:hypothetical protein